MTTIIINDRTAKGKSLIAFLKKFKGEDFIHFGDEPNEETIQSIQEAQEGKTNSYKDSKELFATLKKKANV
jgi:hypothetical protein